MTDVREYNFDTKQILSTLREWVEVESSQLQPIHAEYLRFVLYQNYILLHQSLS